MSTAPYTRRSYVCIDWLFLLSSWQGSKPYITYPVKGCSRSAGDGAVITRDNLHSQLIPKLVLLLIRVTQEKTNATHHIVYIKSYFVDTCVSYLLWNGSTALDD